MLANIIVFDVGSTYTKAAAFHMKEEELTFLGRGQSPTTLNRILDGADAALDQIRNQGVALLIRWQGADSSLVARPEAFAWLLSDICRE